MTKFNMPRALEVRLPPLNQPEGEQLHPAGANDRVVTLRAGINDFSKQPKLAKELAAHPIVKRFLHTAEEREEEAAEEDTGAETGEEGAGTEDGEQAADTPRARRRRK